MTRSAPGIQLKFLPKVEDPAAAQVVTKWGAIPGEVESIRLEFSPKTTPEELLHEVGHVRLGHMLHRGHVPHTSSELARGVKDELEAGAWGYSRSRNPRLIMDSLVTSGLDLIDAGYTPRQAAYSVVFVLDKMIPLEDQDRLRLRHSLRERLNYLRPRR